MRTYRGSCHCGRVVFEIDTELDSAAFCNCSICRRRNALMHRVPPDRFRLIQGEDALVHYHFNTGTAEHYFCETCGIYPYHRPRLAPDSYTVNVYCLEGVSDDDIQRLQISQFDGQSFSTVDGGGGETP